MDDGVERVTGKWRQAFFDVAQEGPGPGGQLQYVMQFLGPVAHPEHPAQLPEHPGG